MKVKLEDLVAMHDIKEGDTIVDCGGYKGDYTAEVLKFNPEEVIVFEPNPKAYWECSERFEDNAKVRVMQLGVGKEGEAKLYLRSDGSSIFKEWAGKEEFVDIKIVKLSEVVPFIDVLKLNCEGCEYDVIEDLDENNLLAGIREILVQFHKVEGWKEGYYRCQRILEKTHKRVYSFKWDLWKRK